MDSFEELKALPGLLGRPSPSGKCSRLFALFAAEPATRPIFDTLTAVLEGPKWKVLSSALANFWLAALLALLPCLSLMGVFLVLHVVYGTLLLGLVGLVPCLLLTMIIVFAAVALAFTLRLGRTMPENLYGLCTGMADPHSLTPFLADLLDRLAAKDPAEGPLTFGDLWGTRDSGMPRDINLQMMSTNLSHGRPYRLPFEVNEENLFYFNPAQLNCLFPERIVKWMCDHARPESDPGGKLVPLPVAADIPVVVAVRMSLSFPFLISAVPMHAREYTIENGPHFETCWFSDGGICSNFPVHFFDTPLPTWPSFAVNLRSASSAMNLPEVFMPDRNSAGLQEWLTRFDDRKGLGRLIGFAGAIINAMQNWIDNSQLKLPGFRDRVVHVCLRTDEGGLNLNMPAEKIETLAELGREAGALLTEHFSPESTTELSWDNHRWIRYRSIMALLEDMLGKVRHALASPLEGDRSYYDLIERGRDDSPLSYRWEREAQRKFAVAATRQLDALAQNWEDSGETFKEGAPRPTPELRVRPRI